MSYKDLALTSLDTIRGYDISSGVHLFTLDELSNATIAQTQEKQDIVGKLGRKLSSFKKNKAVTVSASNGLVSGGLFELQTGSKFDVNPAGGVTVRIVEELTVSGVTYEAAAEYSSGVTYYEKTSGTNGAPDTYTAATIADATAFTNAGTLYVVKSYDTDATKYVASGTAGKEIVCIDFVGSDNVITNSFTGDNQNSGVASGKFKYDTTSKVISFYPGDATPNGTVVVHYDTKIQGDILENKSDKYSGKCRLYVDATAEDICGNQYHVQFHLPKTDVSGEFSLEMGDNQTVHAFEAEALSGSCGLGAVFFEYIVFGLNSSGDATPASA